MENPLTLSTNSKMTLEMEIEGDTAMIRPVGIVDEDAVFSVIITAVAQTEPRCRRLKFDMSRVSRMNSCGVREWLLFLERMPNDIAYHFENVNELLVEQANMIPGILGKKGTLVSHFEAPYFCGQCKADVVMTLEPQQVKFSQGIPVAPQFNCPSCAGPLQFDWIEEEYFSFIKRL